MEMCVVCDNIQLTKWFASPKEYMQCLNYIQKLLDSGDFEMESQTCDLDKVKNDNGYWVDDLIAHTIRCRHCGQAYTCSVDTYHGNGRFREGR
jgi:hypothetical protein